MEKIVTTVAELWIWLVLVSRFFWKLARISYKGIEGQPTHTSVWEDWIQLFVTYSQSNVYIYDMQ